jgi:ribosomal protein L40E
MRCTNCDARIPRGATSCPNCGVYALDEPPKAPLPPRRNWWPLATVVLIIAIAPVAWWWIKYQPQFAPPVEPAKPLPVHVVRDRPGGNVAEAEAIRALRSYLVVRGTPADCVAILSNGLHGGAYQLTALDRCKNIKLGPWSVDAKTHEVKMR